MAISLDLLRMLYEPDAVLPLDESFYLDRWDDIQKEGVASQIYWLLRDSHRLTLIPEVFKSLLEAKFKEQLGANLYFSHVENQVLQTLDARKIRVISLKGPTFSRRFFGHSAARSVSDIDVLVPLELVSTARSALEAVGFADPFMPDPTHCHYALRKFVPQLGRSIDVELHWSLLKEETTQIHFESLWQSAVSCRDLHYARDLDAFGTFYVMCLHGANHGMETSRVYLDIVQMLYRHAPEIDFQKVFRLARKDKVWRRVQRVLSLVYAAFPDLDRLKPFEWKAALNAETDWNRLVDNRWYSMKLAWLRLLPGPRRVLSYGPAPLDSRRRAYLRFYGKRISKLTTGLWSQKRRGFGADISGQDR